ncbi:hypothetical protein AUG19_01345 [archaeon 13_1_20CM_2_54_9]|nr:MAG: hypothetical protein AUJ07_05955 [Crenarchaeota archaeon 13_1_40CM_3_53_5]OLE77135.1 MAG: hypothetical protein AUG19_01345 [archaeon 13_1_20CM_2_54_9]
MNSTSYFRPYRNYFIAIYVAFLAFPARELVLLTDPDKDVLLFSTQIMILSAVLIAVLWGYLATRLYLHPERFSLSSILRPSRRIHYIFIVYLIPLITTLTVSWALPQAFDTSPTRTADYLLSGTPFRVVGYSPLFLAIGTSVIVAFVGYPLIVLGYLRSQLKDEEVRSALWVIATIFGFISTLILAAGALNTLGVSLEGVANLVSTALLAVVVNAFRKPSFLKAFLTSGPTHLGLKLTDRIAVIYSNNRERMAPVSRYINEGLTQNARIVFFFHDDESVIREHLTKEGVNVRHLITKGDLRFISLGSLYENGGRLDEEAALSFSQQLVSEARATDKNALRLIIDFGDYAPKPWQRFADHLASPRWSTSDHFLDIMMMFQAGAFQGQQDALDLLKSRVQVIDLTEGIETFSKGVGLSHQEIAGRKILLEYDPLSDYDRVIRSLVAESTSNFEGIVVFTRKDSPVYTLVGEEPRLKVFILTSKVSYPKLEARDRFLLPAFDTSLLLDALNKTIETYKGASFTVIFDNMSHYVFTMGADKTQSFVRQSLELMISDKITAVYLMNPGAHDQKTVSTFENLFDMEIVCHPETRIPEVRKKMALSA